VAGDRARQQHRDNQVMAPFVIEGQKHQRRQQRLGVANRSLQRDVSIIIEPFTTRLRVLMY
jgi:hypothetical protein